MEFALLWRGLRLRVDVRSDEVTYSLRNGTGEKSITLVHHGELVTVSADKPVTMGIPERTHVARNRTSRPAALRPGGRPLCNRRINGLSMKGRSEESGRPSAYRIDVSL